MFTNYSVAHIKNVREYLKHLNVPDNQVFFEYFGENIKEAEPTNNKEEAGDGFTISLLRSEKEVRWDRSKGTILELCESIGLSPAYSCRMGTCSTCESKLVQGTYEYDPEPFMEASEGNIFICCAVPTSDIEIEL